MLFIQDAQHGSRALDKTSYLPAYSDSNDSNMVATCIACFWEQILGEIHNHCLCLIGPHYHNFGDPEQYVSKISS